MSQPAAECYTHGLRFSPSQSRTPLLFSYDKLNCLLLSESPSTRPRIVHIISFDNPLKALPLPCIAITSHLSVVDRIDRKTGLEMRSFMLFSHHFLYNKTNSVYATLLMAEKMCSKLLSKKKNRATISIEFPVDEQDRRTMTSLIISSHSLYEGRMD